VETPRPIWWLVLNLIILSFRPTRSGKKYEQVWNRERNEGPLKTITRAQSEALAARVGSDKVMIDWAMRYGSPSIASRIAALHAEGCERILIVPLYPQYSASTSATVADDVFAVLKTMRWQPAVRIAPPYYDDPAYIDALAEAMRAELAGLDFEPEKIIASFHGIPQAYFDKGDPYYCHCAKTTRLLGEKLGLGRDRLLMAFQSRFGPAEWLKPYFDVTLEKLAKDGLKRVAVVTPGFSADCLETIEEIGMEGRETFLHNGGEKYHRFACLNDSAPGMQAIEAVVRRELSGWV
jgi:ferrochelatase